VCGCVCSLVAPSSSISSSRRKAEPVGGLNQGEGAYFWVCFGHQDGNTLLGCVLYFIQHPLSFGIILIYFISFRFSPIHFGWFRFISLDLMRDFQCIWTAQAAK